MADTLRFELVLEAEAEVTRACCGGHHEFGECPLDNPEKKEEDR
jgi:hypothetical protein